MMNFYFYSCTCLSLPVRMASLFRIITVNIVALVAVVSSLPCATVVLGPAPPPTRLTISPPTVPPPIPPPALPTISPPSAVVSVPYSISILSVPPSTVVSILPSAVAISPTSPIVPSMPRGIVPLIVGVVFPPVVVILICLLSNSILLVILPAPIVRVRTCWKGGDRRPSESAQRRGRERGKGRDQIN